MEGTDVTTDNFNYLENKQPNIYLKIIIKKINYGTLFSKKLNEYNISYDIKITNHFELIFYKIQKEFNDLFNNICNEKNSNNELNYYLLIKSFVLLYRQ